MAKDNIKTYYALIHLVVFRCSVLVLVAKNEDDILTDFLKIYKKFGIKSEVAKQDLKEITGMIEEDVECSSLGRCIRTSSGDNIIIYYEDNIAKVPKETIVHETHHASTYVCSYRGINDEECEAYIQEYLFHETLILIDKWNDNQKKLEDNNKKVEDNETN